MSDILTPFPHRIGDWAIDHVLGRGAMAVVFAARDADGRWAALKLATGLDDTARERFRREVEACSRLEHPGIVRILAVGEHDGQPWYAMEWVGTATLADLLSGNSDPYPNDLPALIAACERQALPPVPLARRRLLPPAVSLRLVGDLCLAVAHAHDHGLVHRDLKPANVLLHHDGRPVICDFGLVADLDRQRRLTATGRVLGTVGYSAPELRGRVEVDERADVYSLGVILRELLTGQPPALDDAGGAGTTGGRRPDDGLARLPRPLRAIIQRAVQPSPHRRLVSARALHADLQRHLSGERVLSRLDPWPLRLLDLLRRHPWGGGLVLAALLVAAGLLTRTAVLAGLERTRWAMPMADLDLTRPVDLDLLHAAGGAWRGTAEGARPDPDPSGTLLHPRPVFGPVRIEAAARLPAGASLALVLAADEAGAGGYRLEPAWGGGPWAALLRGDDLLWLGRGPGPGTAELLLEADGGRLRFRLGGADRTLVDPLPLFGGWCGVRADGGASVQRLVMLRVAEVQAERRRTLDELKPELKRIIGGRRAWAALRSKAEALAKRAAELGAGGLAKAIAEEPFAALKLTTKTETYPTPHALSLLGTGDKPQAGERRYVSELLRAGHPALATWANDSGPARQDVPVLRVLQARRLLTGDDLSATEAQIATYHRSLVEQARATIFRTRELAEKLER